MSPPLSAYFAARCLSLWVTSSPRRHRRRPNAFRATNLGAYSACLLIESSGRVTPSEPTHGLGSAHQLFRLVFITFGARPGGALLGRPGAIMGGHIRNSCHSSPSLRVGPRERARVQHRRGILPSDVPRSLHGGRIRKCYGDSRAGICWLVMDNVVDSLMGDIIARLVDAAWHASELFPGSTSPRQGARRCHPWFTT